MKVTQATGPIASRYWENLPMGFAICSPASEGEWRVSGGWQIWVLKTQIFMRLLFQKASTGICSLGFTGMNNRVAAHLPGMQFLVINTGKEMDMNLLYDIMVWLEQNRETGHPSAWLWQHGARGTASPSPPILHPPAGLAGQLLGLVHYSQLRFGLFCTTSAWGFWHSSCSHIRLHLPQSFELDVHFSQPEPIGVPCKFQILLIHKVSDLEELGLKRDEKENHKVK